MQKQWLLVKYIGTKLSHLRVLILVILAVGLLLTWWTVQRAEQIMREELLVQTRFVTNSLNLNHLKSLTGTEADLDMPGYLRVKEHLAAVRSAKPQCRFLYLIGRKTDGTVFFFVDNEPVGSKDESPPGMIYDDVPDGFRRVFATEIADTEGPYTDQWGTFISGAVPISDPQTGAVVAVLGMDIDAHAWKGMLAHAALLPLLLTLMLVTILWIGSAMLAWRSRIASEPPRWMWRIEPALAAAVGLVLTLFAARMVHEWQTHNRNQAFMQLAMSRTEAITKTLNNLRSIELESLASFYEASENVTVEEFQQFTAHLTKNHTIQAWEWIPAVSAADKSRFESEARKAGLMGFEIWQKDAQGKREFATGREVYYPVFHVSPLVDNERALGYDLGSEPLRYAALEEAACSGLTASTNPITLVQEKGNQKEMRVYWPVFGGDDPKCLRGFTSAVLRMGTLLQSAGQDDSVLIDISLLRRDAAAELLATSGNIGDLATTRLSVTRHIFIFGKSFAVTAHAGPAFMRLYKVMAGWQTFLAGCLFTAMLTTLISLFRRRREELNRLVFERTNAMQKSEEKHRQIFEHAISAIAIHEIVLDAEGRPVDYIFLNANPAFETHTGLRVADILGRRITEVLANIDKDFFIEVYGKVTLTGESVSFERFSESLGRHYSINAYRLEEDRFATVFTDITERKRADKEIKHNLALIGSLLDSIPDIIFFKDVNGVYLGCNPSFAKFVGQSKEEIVGRTDYDLFDKEIADSFHEHDQHMLELCEFRHNEEWVTHHDGRKILLDTLKTPYWGPDGMLVGILGISRDITDRNQSEEMLRSSEHQLNAMFNSSPVGMMLINESTEVARINVYLTDIIGKESEELLGLQPGEIFNCANAHNDKGGCGKGEACGVCPIRGAMTQVLETGRPIYNTDVNMSLLIDGEIKNTWLSFSLVQIEIEECRHVMTAFVDITERKQAEEEKGEIIAEMERMNRLMTGREMRVIEMKKEVNALLAELGKEPEYKSVLKETGNKVTSSGSIL